MRAKNLIAILGAVFLSIMTLMQTGRDCMAAGYVIPAEDFEYIPAGTFTMGDMTSQYDDEKPAHPVTITNAFGMQHHEVTQGQWFAVMGTKPWTGKDYVREGDDFPAVYISWDDVQAFIAQLNSNAGKTLFRLPTEAEWEYACRAGTTTEYSFGDDTSMLGNYAWFYNNAWDIDEKWAHEVTRKHPNPWCLYDMHGNVFEWCSDWYGINYYKSSPTTDPKGPDSGDSKVIRGGSFRKIESECRSARRQARSTDPSLSLDDLGFRLVRTDVQPRKPALSDLVPVLQVCAGMDNTLCLLHGDINHDGRIDLVDAIEIFQFVSGQRN